MAWVKLDDAMPHHPKIVAAGPLAFALDVAGIAYANRYDLEGFLPDAVITAVLPGLPRPKKHAGALVGVGRWERDDERGGWIIHDWEHYQFTASEIEQRKTDKAAHANHVRWHERRGMTDPDCSFCVPQRIPEESSNDPPGIPPTNPPASPVPGPEPGEDLGLEENLRDQLDNVGDDPPGRNGSPAADPEARRALIESRHSVHVAQDSPIAECGLCQVARPEFA